MKKPLFIFLLAFLITYVLIYSIEQNIRVKQIEMIKKFYISKIHDNLMYISLSYFQWNTMYDILKGDLQQDPQRFFDEMSSYYPFIENVQIIPTEKMDFEVYDISTDGDKLKVQFKVFNDDVTEYVKDKVVSLTINPQMILDSLMIDWIKISTAGKNFVFGLKYQTKRSVIDLTSPLLSFLTGAFFAGYISLNEMKKKLKIEQESKKEEQLQRESNQTIFEISIDLLRQYENEEIYQKMLQKMIKAVPNAQGGSVLIKRNDKFEYVAAVGFDLNELSKISFDDEAERRWINPPYVLKKRDDIRSIYKEADPTLLSLLRTAGRIDEIKCTVSVPIEIE